MPADDQLAEVLARADQLTQSVRILSRDATGIRQDLDKETRAREAATAALGAETSALEDGRKVNRVLAVVGCICAVLALIAGGIAIWAVVANHGTTSRLDHTTSKLATAQRQLACLTSNLNARSKLSQQTSDAQADFIEQVVRVLTTPKPQQGAVYVQALAQMQADAKALTDAQAYRNSHPLTRCT